MRGRVAVLLLLAGCFPDADKLRSGGVTPVGGQGPTAGMGFGGNTGGAPGGAGGGIGPGGSGGGPGGAGGGPGGAGGNVGGTGGVSAARAQLCAEYATAYAAKAIACAPFTAAYRFGSESAYAARLRLNCGLFDLPSVRFPPSPFPPCADALRAQPCNSWLDGVVPPACDSTGMVAEGGVCATGTQCRTDLCDLAANGCGRCIRAPTMGQPCHRTNCAAGLVCNPASICVAPATSGQPCDANTPCLNSLGCHMGTCGPRSAPGSPCKTDDECDFPHGSICTSNLMCVMAVVGPTCGARADGMLGACSAGANCQTNGSCVPPAAEGAVCSMAREGPPCLWPAVCSTADMHCRIFAPSRTCGGTVAVGPQDPRRTVTGLEGGVEALWRSMLPRPIEGF